MQQLSDKCRVDDERIVTELDPLLRAGGDMAALDHCIFPWLFACRGILKDIYKVYLLAQGSSHDHSRCARRMAVVPAPSNDRKSRAIGALQEGIPHDRRRLQCGCRPPWIDQPGRKHTVADADCGFGGGRCRHHGRSAFCLTLPSLSIADCTGAERRHPSQLTALGFRSRSLK